MSPMLTFISEILSRSNYFVCIAAWGGLTSNKQALGVGVPLQMKSAGELRKEAAGKMSYASKHFKVGKAHRRILICSRQTPQSPGP